MENISPQDALEQMGERTTVKTYIPTKGEGRVPLEGVAQVAAATILKVNFPPDSVPLNIDRDGEFMLSFNAGGPTYAMHGRIRQVVNDRQLLLIVEEAYEHPQKRQHFRIDADIPVKYWKESEDVLIPEMRPAVRERVNLSGGGILLGVDIPVSIGERLGVEMILPGPPGTIVQCTGRIVRVVDRGKAGSDVALHFVDIGAEDQEEVIGFCFAEQRRQLRTKVEVSARR